MSSDLTTTSSDTSSPPFSPALDLKKPKAQGADTPAVENAPFKNESVGQSPLTFEYIEQRVLSLLDGLHRVGGDSLAGSAGNPERVAARRNREARERRPPSCERAPELVMHASPAVSPPPQTPPPIDSDSEEAPLVVGIDCFAEILDDYYGSGAPVDDDMMPELSDELIELYSAYEN